MKLPVSEFKDRINSIERSSPSDDRKNFKFQDPIVGAMMVNFTFEYHRWYHPNQPDSLDQMDFLKWKKTYAKKSYGEFQSWYST